MEPEPPFEFPKKLLAGAGAFVSAGLPNENGFATGADSSLGVTTSVGLMEGAEPKLNVGGRGVTVGGAVGPALSITLAKKLGLDEKLTAGGGTTVEVAKKSGAAVGLGGAAAVVAAGAEANENAGFDMAVEGGAEAGGPIRLKRSDGAAARGATFAGGWVGGGAGAVSNEKLAGKSGILILLSSPSSTGGRSSSRAENTLDDVTCVRVE